MTLAIVSTVTCEGQLSTTFILLLTACGVTLLRSQFDENFGTVLGCRARLRVDRMCFNSRYSGRVVGYCYVYISIRSSIRGRLKYIDR